MKLVERLRWDGVICPPHEMPPDTDPNITALAGFANEATVHGKTALRALEMLANQGTAIRRLVHELGEARNNLIQARNERDEDRQQRRDLHARYAVEISALRADRDRLRQGLIDTGRNIGAFLADQVSNDFLMHIPAEAKAKVERLTKDRDRLAKLVAEMAAWIRPLASAAAGLGDDGPDDRPVPIGRLSGGPMRFRADIVLTLGDLRRARALLQRTQEQVG